MYRFPRVVPATDLTVEEQQTETAISELVGTINNATATPQEVEMRNSGGAPGGAVAAADTFAAVPCIRGDLSVENTEALTEVHLEAAISTPIIFGKFGSEIKRYYNPNAAQAPQLAAMITKLLTHAFDLRVLVARVVEEHLVLCNGIQNASLLVSSAVSQGRAPRPAVVSQFSKAIVTAVKVMEQRVDEVTNGITEAESMKQQFKDIIALVLSMSGDKTVSQSLQEKQQEVDVLSAKAQRLATSHGELLAAIQESEVQLIGLRTQRDIVKAAKGRENLSHEKLSEIRQQTAKQSSEYIAKLREETKTTSTHSFFFGLFKSETKSKYTEHDISREAARVQKIAETQMQLEKLGQAEVTFLQEQERRLDEEIERIVDKQTKAKEQLPIVETELNSTVKRRDDSLHTLEELAKSINATERGMLLTGSTLWEILRIVSAIPNVFTTCGGNNPALTMHREFAFALRTSASIMEEDPESVMDLLHPMLTLTSLRLRSFNSLRPLLEATASGRLPPQMMANTAETTRSILENPISDPRKTHNGQPLITA